jgi:Uma2 family endonuclease
MPVHHHRADGSRLVRSTPEWRTGAAPYQGDKRINYGRAGIPVYWTVNLVERQVEAYSSPQPDGYAVRTVYRPGDYVAVVSDGAIVGQIAVAEILP